MTDSKVISMPEWNTDRLYRCEHPPHLTDARRGERWRDVIEQAAQLLRDV